MTPIAERPVARVEPPSAAKILTATAVALVVAAVILVLFVLPAEYGIDPAGTGKKLGLNELVKAGDKPASASAPTADASIAPVLVPSPKGDAPTVKGAFLAQPSRFHVDSRELILGPNEGLEIKYNMKKGAGLLYSWTATGTLSVEFHGEPDVKPEGREGTDYYESYDLDTVGKNQGHGTFLAPSQGIHGWFWENKGSTPVTLKLVTAGFYDWIVENIKNKQRALKPMDPYEGPSHPTVPDQVLK
jgi:hypothetical protein